MTTVTIGVSPAAETKARMLHAVQGEDPRGIDQLRQRRAAVQSDHPEAIGGAMSADRRRPVAIPEIARRVGRDMTPAAVEHAFKAVAESRLANVDWTRRNHWLSVGAKQGAKGVITLGGPKETGSLVHKALRDGVLAHQAAAAAKCDSRFWKAPEGAASSPGACPQPTRLACQRAGPNWLRLTMP